MRFFIAFMLLFFSMSVFANDSSYVSKDGKSRYSLGFEVTKEGVQTTAQRQYLPAVTDGKIIDHPPSKKGKFTIPPSAKKIASKFGRGLNLALAVDLLFDGIDYMMDPANNSVTFHDLQCKSSIYGFSAHGVESFKRAAQNHFNDRATYRYSENTGILYREYPNSYNPKSLISVEVGRCDKKETEVLTDEQIAEKIIELAKQGNKAAQDIVIESVKQDVEAGEYDDILFEVTKEGVEPETETETETSEKDKEKDKDKEKEKDLPGFCKWAKFICDDRVADNSSPVDVSDDVIDFKPLAEKSYINLPKTCPSNPQISFTLPFVDRSESLEFPLDKFCQAFALFKIVVILFAYIKALAIVGSGL